MNDKSSLRGHFIELLKKQGSIDRQEQSRRITGALFNLPVFQNAKTVLFYASLPGEVDTFAMIQQAIQLKKHVALPVLESDQRMMIPTLTDSLEDLHTGPHGIKAPRPQLSKALDINALDVVIVPGLAFDKANNRLGRGAGYYDRFLARLPAHATTIGLAFDFQIVDYLPIEDHDIPLNHIIAG